MISMDYVIKEAHKFKKTNTATLYKDKSNAYKIIERNTWFSNEILSNIVNNYLLHDEVSKNLILPTELIMDDKSNLRGYRCQFVKGYDLDKLAKNLSTEERIIILNKMTDLLKEINEFLVVGDINLANCMFDKDLNAYLIDFDLSTFIAEEPSKIALYNFNKKGTNKVINSNLNTDKLKMAIICASVLYQSDFEESFVSTVPYNKWNKFYQYTNNSYLKDYFKTAFKHLNHDEIIDDYLYLPTDKEFIKLVNEDMKMVRKKY